MVKKINKKEVRVFHSSDIVDAQKIVKTLAKEVGFTKKEIDELILVTRELVSNLVKHAKRGKMVFTPIFNGKRKGIKIESIDEGKGIPDAEKAITDGYSTSNSLGFGLGAINRIMDEFEIISPYGRKGTCIITKKWITEKSHHPVVLCPLEFGAATRPCPGSRINGDSFVIIRNDRIALVAVIDGLGHGQFAYKAARNARNYIERHYTQPLENIFAGVDRACRSTRGVVMAMARFELLNNKMLFGSIGNIGVKVFGTSKSMNFVIRRGIIGLNAPRPVITEHEWDPSYVMVLFSDGIRSHWGWKDFSAVAHGSATEIARYLLHKFAREDDDATVLVIRGKK